ncbi:hypothetical protein C8T65DRAFT_192968 [Cerioporus squamosus]|nr:hypothetical protein C8T65DRAFT_192968 [Cerioporus squamosus]
MTSGRLMAPRPLFPSVPPTQIQHRTVSKSINCLTFLSSGTPLVPNPPAVPVSRCPQSKSDAVQSMRARGCRELVPECASGALLRRGFALACANAGHGCEGSLTPILADANLLGRGAVCTSDNRVLCLGRMGGLMQALAHRGA